MVENVCELQGHTYASNMPALQSVRSMTTALGGIFVATAREASFEVAGIEASGPLGPHHAALNARSVAGDVVSPGIGLVQACGVLGEKSDCEGDPAATGVRAVNLCSEASGSPWLCVEFAELVKENSRGSLKTAGGNLTWLSASGCSLRFLAWGFVDAKLPSFGGLPRFLGVVSVMVVSVEAEMEDFWGLPRFFIALSTATVAA
jgi:hypothetical protein